jgi:hypothetical protein
MLRGRGLHLDECQKRGYIEKITSGIEHDALILGLGREWSGEAVMYLFNEQDIDNLFDPFHTAERVGRD